MKKLLLITIVFFNLSIYAQSEIKITSKKCIPKKGFYLKLKSIPSDSRCPENVTCVWAGEVTVIMEVYNDEQFLEEKTVTFNSKYTEENNLWFSKYYPNTIKSISVLPYPEAGVDVNAKEYYILIRF